MSPPPRLTHVVLPVDDLARALPFYERLLGVEARFRDGDRWAELELPGGLRLALAGPSEQAAGGQPCLLLRGEDLDAARAWLDAAGAVAGPGAREGAHERTLVFADPEGLRHLLAVR